MATLPDCSVDMVLTDPPYGITACKWDSIVPFEPMWEQLQRIIKKNRAIALFGSQPFISALIMSNAKKFHCEWIWHKSRPSGIAFKNQPMRNHEHIAVFNKPSVFNPILEDREGFTESSIRTFESGSKITYKNYGCEIYGGLGLNDRKVASQQRKPTTIRKFGSIPNNLGTYHPSQKPVPLMEYLIKTYTNEGETVLDFTMGSGTTGVACANLERDFIGIELDPEYFAIATKRIDDALNGNGLEQMNLF